jgi:hypothetical protein
MKRLRISAGSRTVCAARGLSSIFAASSTGPPLSNGREISSSKCVELGDKALSQLGAIEHGQIGHCFTPQHSVRQLRVRDRIPPVSSGERMNATDACVATACLIDESRTNASLPSSMSV